MNCSTGQIRKLLTSAATIVIALILISATAHAQPLHGTLVVAVPVEEGLVACADKRLFNVETGTYTDNNVKIRRVEGNVLFTATGTIGFLDNKTGKMAFDAFELTASYTSRNRFVDNQYYWGGLKGEIRSGLRKYFATHDVSEWPTADPANNNLLFSLILYSVDGGRARSHTLRIFYEKKRSPVINIDGPLSETIRFPELSGKGQELMAYLGRDPSLASDPSILKFDERRFDIAKISIDDAVAFARTLFRFANTRVPEAQVSSSFDCALLSYQGGFRWVEGGGGK
jgi:hypothetical protein